MPATTFARGAVVRSALLFIPFMLISLGVIGFIVQDMVVDGANAGGIVALVLIGFVSLLLVYQVVQTLRDLFAQPVETTGIVDRLWSRHDFLVFRNDYVFVEGDVFRIEPEHALDVGLGRMVRITHYPHTNAVVHVEIVSQAEGANA
ncbi:MAG: hypothetical protein WBD55_12595 [Dehalococcoidia bacterium]